MPSSESSNLKHDARDVEKGPDAKMPDSMTYGISYVRKSTSSLEGVVLKFEDIKFVVGQRKNEKVIIQQVGATIRNGHVLAIMGPSGAGKTTLISALTQNAFYGQAYGSVTLNGVPMNNKIFKRYCYLVKQHDTNWPYLTARETLTYAAELYDVTADKESTMHLVQDVIRKTGLGSCADTRCARLSGGQQRRLSLAVALLKQPSVLFLDEPTSGLDAAAASAIMREITRVAKEERLIIVCTIHQPSSKVYNGFDQVMILSKGRVAYVGKAHTATDYFDSIGYVLPPKTNPAEHLLDIVNSDFSSNSEVDHLLDTWSNRPSQIPKQRNHEMYPSEHSLLETTMNHNLSREIQVMFRRHITLMFRDPIMYAGRIIGFLLVNCVFGVVYIAARNYTQDQAVNKLWVSGWYIGVPANMAVVAVYKLNLELKSIFLENKNGMGSAISYIFAKTVIVTPIFFLFALAALGIPGYVIQIFPPATFGKMILLFTAQIAIWESSGEAFASIFDEAILGMLVHTAWWFAALLFSGYLVALQDMYWPLKFFYYVLPYSYYIRSAMYLIFSESTWEPCTDITSSAVCVDSSLGIHVLAGLERIFPLVSTESTYWGDLLALFSIGVFWKLVAVTAIIVRSRRVSSIMMTNEHMPRQQTVAMRPLPSTSYAAGTAVEVVVEVVENQQEIDVPDNKSDASLEC